MSFSSLVSWAAAASRSLPNMAAMPSAISVLALRSSASAGASAQSSPGPPGPGPHSSPLRRPSPSLLARLASHCSPLVAASVITSSCHETCFPRARRQPRLTYATYVRPPAPATARKPEPGAGWQALLTGAQRLDELLLVHG